MFLTWLRSSSHSTDEYQAAARLIGRRSISRSPHAATIPCATGSSIAEASIIITAKAAGQSTELIGFSPDERGTALRERIAKLEVQMAHLSEKLDDTHKKVEEMHAILLQAKGTRWVIVGLAGVAGVALGSVAKLMPWSGARPR